jgi:type IV pilus assembly protein PilP
MLSGCSPKLDDLVIYTNQIKQNTKPRVEPYPEFTAQPTFIYSAGDKRSPFSKPKENLAPITTSVETDCIQPDFKRQKEPLENYGIDALTLTGSFRIDGRDWVLFKSNDGGLFQATIGSRIGLFYGRISSLDNGKVTIQELVPDGAGCWQKKETTLTIKS